MNLIVTLVVLCIVFGLAWWIITQIPGFAGNWIVRAVFGLVALLLVVGLFTGGVPTIGLRL